MLETPAHLWPHVPLGELLIKSNDWIDLVPTEMYREVTVRLWGKGVALRRHAQGSEIKSDSRLRVRSGQFILSRIDARNGAIGLVPSELDGAVVSSDFPVFDIRRDRLQLEFLGWMSRTSGFVELCRAASEGTTNRVRLKEARFLQMPIPLPPLDEQKRIVATIDEVATKIGEAGRLRDKAAHDTDHLLDAAMRSTFEGLRGCLEVTLEQVCDEIIDCLHSNPVFAEDGVPTVRSPDVGWGRLLLEHARRTGEDEYQRRTRRGEPCIDDIVLVREGGGTGKAGIVEDGQRFSLGQRVMMLRPKRAIVRPRFLLFQWLSPLIFRHQITERMKGSASPHLNINSLRKFKFICPSLAEQDRVVGHLQEIRSTCDRLSRLHAETTRDVDAMLPAVLNAAFTGVLVAAAADPSTPRVAVTPDGAARPPRVRKHSSTIYFKRAAIAAYIIDRLHTRPTFGRVQLEKCLYLAEAYVGVDLEGEFKRAAAGPLDAEYLYKLESAAQKNGWFVKRTIAGDKTRHTYHPGAKSAQLLAAAEKYLGAGKARMDHLLGWMEKFDTERAEIVATLFAAWSDLLRAGVSVTDDAIITEVRENWHESKKRFEPARLRIALGWMREHALVPPGTGPTPLKDEQ